jgi:hypothetical protein|tara:strand:+ start:37 stop:243 length:207 start_codon:yes stop_codon:yes gene_type:complete
MLLFIKQYYPLCGFVYFGYPKFLEIIISKTAMKRSSEFLSLDEDNVSKIPCFYIRHTNYNALKLKKQP